MDLKKTGVRATPAPNAAFTAVLDHRKAEATRAGAAASTTDVIVMAATGCSPARTRVPANAGAKVTAAMNAAGAAVRGVVVQAGVGPVEVDGCSAPATCGWCCWP